VSAKRTAPHLDPLPKRGARRVKNASAAGGIEFGVRRKKIKWHNPEGRGAVPAPKDENKNNKGVMTPPLRRF